MTCDERQPLWLEYAAGTLDAAEAGPLRAHLASGCPQCAATLAEAEAVFHQIPRGLTPKPAPEEAWERLQDRIALHAQLEGPAEVMAPLPRIERPAPRRGSPWGWVFGLAATAAAVALVVLLYQANDRAAAQRQTIETLSTDLRSQITGTEKQVATLTRQITSLQDQVTDDRKANDALKDALAAARKDSDLQVASLLRSAQFEGSSDKQPSARGRLYWDKVANTWVLYAQNLKDMGPGKTYELWIVTADNKKLPAGVASPDANGDLMIKTTIPPTAGDLVAAALTDEAAGGVPVGQGQIQFLALVGK